jgi:8-oxo-dGTP pyrophosphatase MutT (NUDIX family)
MMIPLFEAQGVDRLAGVALIYNGKVVLVNPKKYRKYKNMWSFPKGHVDDGYTSKEAAFKELSEETGIEMDKDNFIDRFVIKYKHGNLNKRLKLYVVIADDLSQYLTQDGAFRPGLSDSEIDEVRLFSYREARKVLQDGMKSGLDYIYTKVLKRQKMAAA